MKKFNFFGTCRAQKHGIWTLDSEDAQFHCAVCRERPLSLVESDGRIFTMLSKFCPSCGAKMNGGKENA